MDDNSDIYDWLELAEKEGWVRVCPSCGDDDFKYGIHDKKTAGVELSVHCNSCRHEDSGDNSGKDAERMVREWHKPSPSSLSSSAAG